jgi:gluconokinase
MQVLVLEASTTSAKALVYDRKAGIRAMIVVPYGKKVGDGAAQDADLVYESLIDAGRQVAKDADIAAVALGGIWHGLVVLDGAMRPVTPVYTWANTDAAGYAAKLRQDDSFTGKAYRATGCMVHATYPVYRLAWLKENGLGLKGRFVADQGSYNFFRLTGERLATKSMESGSGFLNIHTLDYDEDMLQFVGIGKQQLGELCGHTDTRPLTAEAADRLDVAPGIPVVPAMADGALNQVGSGALGDGLMTLSVGTSAALRMTSNGPVIPDVPSTWCYYTAGKHLCGAATSGATNCVDWYMQTILGGRKRYGEIEAEIKNREDAPIFMPFLFGERCPGWRDDRKGGLHGLTGYTSAAEQYYAVLEGVLFNLYQCYLELVKITGEPEKIFVSGGICYSGYWLSMLADLFQKEITLLANEQASLLGGAVLALHAAGGIEDIADFTVKTKKILKPDAENSRLFQARFGRYLDIYERMI